MYKNQRGVAQIVVILLLLAGLGGGLYLVQNRTNLLPKAAEPSVAVAHYPNPIYADSKRITFSVTTPDSSSGLHKGGYTYRITSLVDPSCVKNVWTGYPGVTQAPGQSSEDVKTIFSVENLNLVPIRVSLKDQAYENCRFIKTGKMRLDIWYGDARTADYSTGNKLVDGYTFEVLQPGGGRAAWLSALNPVLGLSQDPEVQITNAKSGTTYTLWWDKSLETAVTYKANYDGTTEKIIVPKKGVDFSKEGGRTLCLKEGDSIVIGPSFFRCNYNSAYFEFLEQPPISYESPSCVVEPENADSNDSITIKAINLPLNQTYKADLVIGENVVQYPQEQSSGESGIVSLHLASSLAAGTYTALVHNVSSEEIVCEQEFTVR